MELVSGKVIQGCSNAGNPFHECTAICLDKLNSVDNVYKKEKKIFGMQNCFSFFLYVFCLLTGSKLPSRLSDETLFYFCQGFGKRTPSRETPTGSPARGSRSPLPSFFAAKKKVESNSPSSTEHTNNNFFSRLSPLHGLPSQLKNEAATSVDSLPMSPTLAGYSGGDYFARKVRAILLIKKS